MATKRVSTTAVDWAKFALNVPAADTAMFHELQSKNTQYRTTVGTRPTELPEIDFARYAKLVPSLKKTIEEFSAKYAQVKIDYPVAPAELQAIDVQEKEHKAATTAWMDASKARVDVAKEGLAEWEKIPPLCHLTLHEWALYFPGFQPDYKTHQFYHAIDEARFVGINQPGMFFHHGNFRGLADSSKMSMKSHLPNKGTMAGDRDESGDFPFYNNAHSAHQYNPKKAVNNPKKAEVNK
jgi:hypothetical protein